MINTKKYLFILIGFLTAILSIGFIAVSLLIIRYTNVYISIAGLIGIITIAKD